MPCRGRRRGHARLRPGQAARSIDYYRKDTIAYRMLYHPTVLGSTPLYSHSIVPGGLLVTSYVTRLIPRTSLTIRFATRVKNAMSNGYTSAVMPSLLVTARSAQALS